MRTILKQACSALALLLCCGCMATSAAGKSTGALPKTTAERLTAATGRFVEADVTPQQLNGTEPLAVIPYADGTVDVFAAAPDGLARYRLTGGEAWERETPQWATAAAAKYGGQFTGVTTANGLCYAALFDGSASHLVEARQDGTFREIPVPAWEAGGFQVKSVTALENGDFGFTYEGRDAQVIDGKTGRSKTVLDGAENGAFFGDRFVADDGKNIVFYDLSTAKRLNAVSAARGRGGAALAAGEIGAVYFASDNGVGRLSAKGSVLETILDGGVYGFSAGDTSFEALARQPGADVFYLLLRRQDQPLLYRYVYRADAPARPNTQLEVFSLADSGTVRRAMIELQRADPSVTVRYQIGAESPLSREETLRALENELKNGKGPDVLILDGLDSAVYGEYLADPGEPEALAACFFNVMSAGVRDGKRYAIPTRFLLPVTVGEAGELSQYGPAGNGQPGSSVVKGTPTGTDGFRSLINLSWNRSVNNAADTDSQYRELVVSADGTLQPTVFAAIRAGGNEALGRRFLDTMLTEFVQQGDFEEGLPVRMDGFDAAIKEAVSRKELNIVTDLKALCLAQETAKTPPDESVAAFLEERARWGY